MMRTRNMPWWALTLAALVLMGVGCNKQQTAVPRTDSQVAADIQNKINSDANLPNKQISVGSSEGVVTLSGTVGSEGERLAAGNDASQVEGVKTVLNNLVVAPANNGMAESTPPETSRRATATRGAGNKVRRAPLPVQETTPPPMNNSNSNTMASSMPPPANVPPPIVDVTVPAGTVLSIRTIDRLDTERAQPGDTFNATLDAPVEVNGHVVIPANADVEGRVADAKNAGKFQGASLLTLQLSKISYAGRSYRIVTDQWSKAGDSRGKNTAEKVGGGAAVGAIIGAIAGGGKGAAIGAGVGAGVGTGAQAVTRGQQVVLNPETVLTFTLRSAVTVTPAASSRTRNRMGNGDTP